MLINTVWVHMDNLFEVKTVILRRLPVLVYNPQSANIAEGSQRDPTITSIYFDNPNFSLYSDKVNGKQDASSLRLRWYGQLNEKPEIMFEKKVIKEGDASEEVRFPIKAKYIQSFLEDKYHMEKSIEKLEYRPNRDQNKIDSFKKAVEDIQGFVREKDLQPVLRANYTRTAFQIPGNDNVRISLDTNMALIREDALDMDRPCREPDDWHRRDIDNSNMEFPFKNLKKGEIHKFPFALLEIKVKGLKKYEWVDDLIHSHLVKEAPRFSKFVHGVAKLFEDNVNTFPFWLSEVEDDIRKEPDQAFDEEQERRRKAAEDDFAVGSLFGTAASPSFRRGVASPIGSPAAWFLLWEDRLSPLALLLRMAARRTSPPRARSRTACPRPGCRANNPTTIRKHSRIMRMRGKATTRPQRSSRPTRAGRQTASPSSSPPSPPRSTRANSPAACSCPPVSARRACGSKTRARCASRPKCGSRTSAPSSSGSTSPCCSRPSPSACTTPRARGTTSRAPSRWCTPASPSSRSAGGTLSSGGAEGSPARGAGRTSTP